VVGAEPAGEAIGVTLEVQLRNPNADGTVGCRSPAWKRCPVSPLDEEGKRGLGGRLLDRGHPPAQDSTRSSRPRAVGHEQAEPLGHLVELVVRTAQPSGLAKAGDASATQLPNELLRLGLVDDSDQLEPGTRV